MKAQSIESMIEKAIDEAMEPENLKIETQDEQGRWQAA